MDPQPFLLKVFLVLDALFITAWVAWRFRVRRPPRPREQAATPSQGATLPPVFRIFFSAESDALDAAARDQLKAAAQYLAGSPQTTVTLTGSADQSGNPSRNARLARDRAAQARQFLVASGVSADRVAIAAREPGWGATAQERERLRCVEVVCR